MRRFLLVNKTVTSMFLICFFGSLISISAASDSSEKAMSSVDLTIEELAKYNGLNGNNAYVAIDSVIYDVTNIKKWKNGKHKSHKAGQDLTAYLKKSPHGQSVLAKLKKVGRLIPAVEKNVVPDTSVIK